MTPLDGVPTEYGDAYVAGTCNIGAAEARTRRRAGVAGAVVTLLLGAMLLLLEAPAQWLLLTALPATGAATGFLQARANFCIGYAARGLSNFTDKVGAVTHSADAAAQVADRARARQLTRQAIAFGLLTGAAFVVVAAVV